MLDIVNIVDCEKLIARLHPAMCGTTFPNPETGEPETHYGHTIERVLRILLDCIIEDPNSWSRDSMDEIKCTLTNLLLKLCDGIPNWKLNIESQCIQPEENWREGNGTS